MSDIHNYYMEQGSGEPMILLHGNGEDHSIFEHQIAYFSQQYHIYAIDTRGHGKTPRGTAPFTIRQFAEDLYDFMEEHEIEKAHILGFSDGGNIALCFAMKYPDKVNRLIVSGANLYSRGVKAQVQLPIICKFYYERLMADFLSSMDDKIASKKNKYTDKMNQRLDKAIYETEMLGLMVNDPNIHPYELRRIKSKTLVIAGTHDLIRESHTEFIAKHIINAELVFIDGDHFICNREHALFNEAIEYFLNA